MISFAREEHFTLIGTARNIEGVLAGVQMQVSLHGAAKKLNNVSIEEEKMTSFD